MKYTKNMKTRKLIIKPYRIPGNKYFAGTVDIDYIEKDGRKIVNEGSVTYIVRDDNRGLSGCCYGCGQNGIDHCNFFKAYERFGLKQIDVEQRICEATKNNMKSHDVEIIYEIKEPNIQKEEERHLFEES